MYYEIILNALRTINQLLTAGIAITAFSLLIYALTFNLRDRVARSFAIIMMCMVIVFVGDALDSVADSAEQMEFWLKFQWLAIVFLPAAYLHLFLPQVQRMVEAFKAAGAAQVGYHSDGEIRSVLDDLVDVGISILNPVEPRANMDVVELRRRYGQRLAFVGGLCNSLVLPKGSDQDVREHVRHVLSIADDGGLVIGSHSISNDVTQDRYNLLMEILYRDGRPRPGWSV